MSNYLPTEYALDQLRTDVEGFTIGGDKGPLWKIKHHTPEEHNALIQEACVNTEFEIREEHITAGRKKKVKTVDLKQESRKVTNKVRELKIISMYGAKINGDFKSLLLCQRVRHLKYNISYDDDCWKPFTMCGFDGAEHTDTLLGTMNIILFTTQIYCKRL